MDDPKQLISRFVEELWNERRLDVADAIFAKDCVTHQLRSGVPTDAVPRGPQAIKEHVAGWIASFPDLHFRVEQMLSEGDRVAMQLLMEGTHQGAWLGMPASGKKMQIRMFTVHRVMQGKIVEDWVIVESLGIFQQLGLVPDTADLVGNFLRQQSKPWNQTTMLKTPPLGILSAIGMFRHLTNRPSPCEVITVTDILPYLS